MLLRSGRAGALLLATCWAFMCAEARAQSPVPPYQVVHTVAAADRAVPVEETLNIANAGTYEITLTDLGAQLPTPAPLESVKLAITGGSKIVGTPLAAPGSSSFSAAPGAYVIHVVGLPGNVPGSGPFGITVTDASNNVVATFSGTLALPAVASPSNEAVLSGSFTVETSGSYQVTLSDLQFPASLGTLTLALIAQGAPSPVATLPATGTTTVSLQSGVLYEIFAVGASSGSPAAGLYSASVVAAGGGMPVYANTIAVGAVNMVANPALSAGNYTLTLADLKLPASLAQLGAVVVLNGQAVAQLAAAGSAPFIATDNTYQVFALGEPSAAGTGGYVLAIQPASGAAAVSIARAVSSPGGAVLAYSYDTQVPSAGGYTLNVADFALPTQFTSLSAVAVQNGAALASPQQGAGAQSIVAAAGPLSLLVFAQAASSGSLFGVDLEPSGTTNPVFATTQGVGQLFSAQQINILSGGTYAVTVSDVGFPSPFANLAVVVTRGANGFGRIYVSGKFSFVATPGNYFLNFVAQPGGSDQAGTYALSVASAPAAPIVTLSSDSSSVASGGTVNLIWTSQNATACTGSGGWSGAQATSGTKTTSPLMSTTTFTLTCTGAGGSSAKSVTISVTTASSSGGGGGEVGLELLLALAIVLVMRQSHALPRVLRHSRDWTSSALRTMSKGRLWGLAILCVLVAGCGGARSRLAEHLQRGQAYFTQGNYAKANVEFRNALQIAPTDVTARLMAGKTAERLGRPRVALGLYQSVLDSTPGNVEARTNLGRLLIFGGVPARGLDVIKPALAAHPDDAVLLTLRAGARLRLNDVSGATQDVDHALRLTPTNEEAVALRAGIYQQQGDLASAISLVGTAVGQLPATTDLREVLARLYLSTHEDDKAEAQLRALVSMRPAEPRYRYLLASFYSQTHRPDDAQRVLEGAVTALPGNDAVKLALVDFLVTQRTPKEGERVLRELIAHEPDNYSLRVGLGTLLQRSGRVDEAIGVYSEVIRRAGLGPYGLIARDHLGAIALAQGRMNDATKLVAEVLERNPRDGDALLLHGQMALARHDAPVAVNDFRAIVRDQPKAAAAYRLLAAAHEANGELPLAVEALRSAVSAAPTDTALRIELARLLVKTDGANTSIALLEQTVTAAPTDLPAREALIRAYLAKPDFAAAMTAAQDLKTLRPDVAIGPYLAGLAAEGQNRPDDARREFKQALSLQPGAFDALSALARLELARGHAAEAVALVKRATERDPKAVPPLVLLGELYMAEKNVPLAITALTQATTLAPGWWAPYRGLALAKIAANDEPGAIAAYEAGIRAAPTEVLLVTELAALYLKHGRADQAIASYEACDRRNPHVPAVENNLAMLLVTYRTDRTSLDRARDLTAGFASSSEGSLLDTNGWVHFKRSEYADALPVLERAAARSPDSREIRYHLAMAELQSGRPDRARSDLETALSGSSTFTGADEARNALAALKRG